MRHQWRILGSAGFQGGLLPLRGFEEISDRLLRDIELVEIEIPGGTMTRNRKRFTPIQEAYFQASQYIDRKEWPKALDALRKVTALNPHPNFLSAIYTMMGMVHTRARNQEAAIKAFKEAIRLNANAEFAHLFLGTALMLSNRFEEAIDAISRALELEPRLLHGNFYLGYLYAKLEKWDKAIDAYNAETESHAQSPEAYQELARLLIRLGDENEAERDQYYLKAIEAFSKWSQISPKDANTRNLIGYLFMVVERPEPAIEAFEATIRLDSNHILGLFNLGTAYLDTDRNREAKEIFERLTQAGESFILEHLERIAPSIETNLQLSMGEAYQKLGAASLKIYQAQENRTARELLEDAEKAFKTSLEYVPSDTHSMYNLGLTHYLMGCRAAAIKEFRHVLEIQPANDDAANNLRVTEEELAKVRHWLGSRVWKRLETSTDATPVHSEDLLDEIAQAMEKIYENIPASHHGDAFTSEDLLQTLQPLMEYIPSVEAIADLIVRIFQRGWLSSAQAARLAGTDLAAFLAYLHLIGVSLKDLAARESNQQHNEATIKALKEVLESNPTDDGARDQLQAILQERLDEKLKVSGLMKEIKGPIKDFSPYQDRILMPVGNESLSEIVIENRR
ncbi:MAG TPA: tetratricopeptide repeat protein [Pyrinomonadaceae bacterium]|nr:tetratricopeptide repeat protein [Pyrinomonadaceae bacterium]